MNTAGKNNATDVNWFDGLFIENSILAKELVNKIGSCPKTISSEIAISLKPGYKIKPTSGAEYWTFTAYGFSAVVEIFLDDDSVDYKKSKLRWVSPNKQSARELLNAWLKREIDACNDTIWIDET
jgi:hypothetical protein